ncbi:hypothetical protein ACERK3_04595 [Phycisphaerales bacterium AB-hyl4]|uniref:RedB protein n=1 Tax=Natronomicrosphaera hydrolytica TaxID=3242702 RepID=A0ABV4U1T5_9BACT
MTQPLQNWVTWSVGLWLVLVGVGLFSIWHYSNTPGETRAATADWSPNAQDLLDSDRPTLVVFIHPRCPCSRATFSELERLQAQRPGTFTTRILFYKPVDADSNWRKTDLWERARRMPDTTFHVDSDGRLARQAGATTSGMVAMYSPNARRLFAGGITPARGHEGANLGTQSILAHLDGQAVAQSARVFGCPLLSPDQQACDISPEVCVEHGICHE